MAIAAAQSLADFAEKRGITPQSIIPTMDEVGVFPQEAADVAMQAVKEGVARIELSFDEVYDRAQKDIDEARRATELLMADNLIKKPSEDMLRDALQQAIDAVK